MRTRQKCVATDTWRSLGCRTTPLEHWSRRKPTVEQLKTLINKKKQIERSPEIFKVLQKWQWLLLPLRIIIQHLYILLSQQCLLMDFNLKNKPHFTFESFVLEYTTKVTGYNDTLSSSIRLAKISGGVAFPPNYFWYLRGDWQLIHVDVLTPLLIWCCHLLLTLELAPF